MLRYSYEIIALGLMGYHRQHSQILLPDTLPSSHEKDLFILHQSSLVVGFITILQAIISSSQKLYICEYKSKIHFLYLTNMLQQLQKV